MTDLFPYTESYAALLAPVELQRSRHRAQQVLLSRGVAVPQGVLLGYAGTTLDGRHAEGELLLDFGRLMVGQAALQITVEQQVTLELTYGETVEEATRREDYAAEWYTLPHDVYQRDLGPWVLRSQGRRAFRYLMIRVPQGQGRVRIESVWGQHAAYPCQARGAFGCSDPQINAIWQMSQATLRNTMQRYYEDGVKRDGLLWIADYRQGYLANAMAFGDQVLARNSLLMIAASQRQDGALPACAARGGGHQHPQGIDYLPGMPHGSVDNWVLVNYCCDFISALKEYVIYSGDRELLATLFPAVTRLLRYLTVEMSLPDLLPAQDYVTDRQPDAGDGWWCSRGALAMQLYWALGDAALLGSWLQVQDVMSLCTTTASLTKRHILKHYWDAERQLYLDAERLARTSWHVNALALLSGVMGAEHRGADLLSTVQTQADARYPLTGLMQFWVLAAQYVAQMDRLALDGMRSYWGAMLSQGATTCWESLDVQAPTRRPERYPLSYCHTWSTGPLFLLPRFVLGVQPVAPGFGRVKIRPQLGGLAWAEGTVPTPRGDLHVRWEALPRLRGWVTLPDGVEGEVTIVQGQRSITRQLIPGDNQVV